MALFGCRPAEDSRGSFSEAEVRSQIVSAADARGDAAIRKDVGEFMTHWAASDSTIYTRHGRSFLGWDEIYADHARQFASPGQWSYEPSELFVTVLGPEAAVATKVGRLSSLNEDGTTSSAWFVFTAAMAKQADSKWRIVQAHSSYPASGMTPRGVPEER
jgi:ketosteroid isomerase-like protein